MAQFGYAMVETVVRVRGRSVTVTDPHANGGVPTVSVEDLVVEVANIADHNDQVTVEVDSGNRRIDASLTADGRLQSLDYNSTGAGGRVVGVVGKLVAFVGALALGGRRGASAGGGGTGPVEPAEHRSEPADPWAIANDAAETQRKAYAELAGTAAGELVKVRGLIVAAADPAAIRVLVARAAAVERVLTQAREELARLAKLREVWLASKRTTTSSAIDAVVRIEDIPRRTAKDAKPPTPPPAGEAGYELWRDFGIILELTAATAEGTKEADSGTSLPPAGYVMWRAPRTVELWVWKRAETTIQLVRREPVVVTDHQSPLRQLELTASFFGEHSGSIVFGDDGQPTHIVHAQESRLGAAADAVGGTVDAVVAGAKQAKELADTLSSLSELGADREKRAADRELAIARARLELAGVHATEDDYAELQRAEQAVKLRTAESALAPKSPDPLAELKRELETVTTQNAIAAERRSAAVDLELAELQSEVSRLRLELKRATTKEALEDLETDDASRAGTGAVAPAP